MRKLLALLAIVIPLTLGVAGCEQDAYQEGEAVEED